MPPSSSPQILNTKGNSNPHDNLMKGEVRHLKGDWIIEGDIPAGAHLDTDGNLDIKGYLGKKAHVTSHNGSIRLTDTDDFCAATAKRGSVTFEDAGEHCKFSGTSVTGDHVSHYSKLKATKGDVTLKTGDDHVTLHASGDLRFETLGEDGNVTAGGTLTYDSMGRGGKRNASHTVYTGAEPEAAIEEPVNEPKTPSKEASGFSYEGKVLLCTGLWHDAEANRYIIELPKNTKSALTLPTEGLINQLLELDAAYPLPEKGPLRFAVDVPDDKPTLSDLIQHLITKHVATVKQLPNLSK